MEPCEEYFSLLFLLSIVCRPYNLLVTFEVSTVSTIFVTFYFSTLFNVPIDLLYHAVFINGFGKNT